MKVKQSCIPIYNIQLSDLEATAALHAMRGAAASIQKRPAESLSSYDKAALAFCRTFETLLVNQGAKNRLDEVSEKYGKGISPREEKVEVPPLQEGKEETYDEGLDSLIEGSAS